MVKINEILWSNDDQWIAVSIEDISEENKNSSHLTV
jgi:hypothetical protein